MTFGYPGECDSPLHPLPGVLFSGSLSSFRIQHAPLFCSEEDRVWRSRIPALEIPDDGDECREGRPEVLRTERLPDHKNKKLHTRVSHRRDAADLQHMKEEMSLGGLRPERPEFFEMFLMEIPLYPTRLTVKPGLTGRVSVNFLLCGSLCGTSQGDARARSVLP